MATEELFREDATLTQCEARITAIDQNEEGAWRVALDRSVFYPLGGGQAGDSGELQLADGHVLKVADTRKDKTSGQLWHVLATPAPAAGDAVDGDGFVLPAVGATLVGHIDAPRRFAHMRFHTATHLLCALVPHAVDGCSITERYARLDFHTDAPLDKEALNAGLARLVQGAHPVRQRWISEAELDANPQLVRSMSVQPPRGSGRVRVLEIVGVDLQPCGGTHVAHSGEVGDVCITKIEKKSAMTRRVVLGFRG